MGPIRLKATIEKLQPEWSDEEIDEAVNQILQHYQGNLDNVLKITKEGDRIRTIAISCGMDIEQLFKEITKCLMDKYLDVTKEPKQSARISRIKIERLLQEAPVELTEDLT